MSDKIETVFVTKNALTEGIEQWEVKIYESGSAGQRRGSGFFAKSEWHRTRTEAVADAERRRVKKVASLKAQIAKLKALRFE